MTTLLTGAGGYLGSAVLERLLADGGGPVRCLVRPGADLGRLGVLRDRAGARAFEIVFGNLCSPADAERATAGVERVIHTAARMRGAPADMFLDSVVGTRNLVDAVTRGTVRRFVHVSSIGVYGLDEMDPACAVAEDTPVDPHPERRDVYSFTKIWQEQIVKELDEYAGISTVILRPGPLYGRGVATLPGRLGLLVGGRMFQLGLNTALPLTYVENCVDAIRFAACSDDVNAGTYNVVDDDPPMAGEYLRRFQAEVRHVPTLRLPYSVVLGLSRVLEWYHHRSRGQVPLVLTPYRVRNMWRGHVYDNTRLKRAGWRQPVATHDALRTAFQDARANQMVGTPPQLTLLR